MVIPLVREEESTLRMLHLYDDEYTVLRVAINVIDV